DPPARPPPLLPTQVGKPRAAGLRLEPVRPPDWQRAGAEPTLRAVAEEGTDLMSPTCPPGVPVVALPPQHVHGFTWGPVIRPQGDACLTGIAVEATNEQAWYVGSP